ncbi:MAG: hypothetical protein ACLSAF_03025 [Intestinimonas sp.]
MREHAGERCEDMESIASYQLCHRFGTPCIGLRIISNNELTGSPIRERWACAFSHSYWMR